MRNCAMSQDLIDLGNRIQNRRQELNLSQEKVAEKAGISANTVSRIEGGHSAMSIEIFMKLVQILDMDANELLGVDILAQGKEDQDSEIVYRIANLTKNEQTVVLQTIDALIEGLQRCRL